MTILYFIILILSPSILGAKSFTLNGNFPKNFATLKKDITKSDLREIKVGYTLFAKPWVQAPSSTIRRDGLGPHFNAVSCMSCHSGMGRGAPPGVRHPNEASLIFKSNSEKLTNLFGLHISPKALPGIKAEATIRITNSTFGSYKLSRPNYTINGKEVSVSPRISPHLAGLSYLEKIRESDLYENLHHSNGKISLVRGQIARFGWKASQVDLADQVAAAFSSDMGITNHLYPKENCQDFDQACLSVQNGTDEEGVEIRKDHIGFVTKLMRSIEAPLALKNQEHSKAGLSLFKKINCSSCHRPTYQIEGRTISPYTDLLLHDMGEELADRGTGENSHFWRTPPLWGIGSVKLVNGHSRFMHDGRARNIREAILWHFGEGSESKKSFLNLSTQQQQHLIEFIETR